MPSNIIPPEATTDPPRVASQSAEVPHGLTTFDKLPDSAHVRLPTVAPLFGVSAPTVWRWVKSGRLPAPKKLGPNTSAWNVGELRRVLASGGAV